MPFFDYECKGCSAILNNKLVKRWDSEVECKECGKTMEKMVSAPSRHGYKLVGEGFYKNDQSVRDMNEFKQLGALNNKLLNNVPDG